MVGIVGHAKQPFDGGISFPWKRVMAGVLSFVILVFLAWVVWSFIRPNPKGYSPTAGAAGTAIAASAEVQFTADARSRQDWVFFSFATGTVVDTTQDALDWDLAFRRTDVLVNGGRTNVQGLGGAVDLGEVSLAAAVAPDSGFVTDIEHEDRGLENPQMHGWYNYNWTTHVVTSKGHTYAVRAADGDATFLVSFLSYYCEDRTAACVTFRYLEAE